MESRANAGGPTGLTQCGGDEHDEAQCAGPKLSDDFFPTLTIRVTNTCRTRVRSELERRYDRVGVLVFVRDQSGKAPCSGRACDQRQDEHNPQQRLPHLGSTRLAEQLHGRP